MNKPDSQKVVDFFDMNKIFNEKKTLKRKNKDKLNLYFECPNRDKYLVDELNKKIVIKDTDNIKILF